MELLDVAGESQRREWYGIGIAVNLAYNNPEELDKLLLPLDTDEQPVQATGMLKIPKKRKREDEDGG